MKLRFICALLATAGLAGCAVPSLTTDQATSVTSTRATQAIQEFQKSAPVAAVREIDGPRLDFTKTDAPRIRGDVNINAKAAPFAPLLSELAKKAGYSVAFGDMVDLNRKVTIDYTNAMTEDAIRTTAFLAGYAAVLDKQNRTIYISDVATYTFRLPAGVFSALQAQYNVGGNPANAGGSGGGAGGAGGGGGGGGTSLKAEFNISGREGSNGAGLSKYLQDLAGKNSEVIVTDNGIISVRANAQALKRVHGFMKSYALDAMTQVEIEASVVEVALTNEFSVGIQWGKVMQTASGATRGTILGGAGAVTQAMTGADPIAAMTGLVNQAGNSSLGSFRVGASTTSIINALAQFTEVNVVSQPRLLSMNNVPATFFDGTQLPYMGSIQQTQGSGTNAQPTVTGTVAFAIDGVSFSAIPSVVDKGTVQITLIPVLSSVQGFSEFLNGQLTAPRQANKQTFMRVLAESNKTLVLGGIRYSADTKDTSLATSTGKKSTAKEIVILLRTNVVAPPADFDPIVSESL